MDSRNQFILNAIEFYIEQYRLTRLKTLPPSIETILSSNLTKLEQNVSSFLFKNAVGPMSINWTVIRKLID